MFNFKVNEKEYNFPTKWEEITLGVYIEICRLEANKDLYDVDEVYLFKMIEVLTGCDPDDLYDMPIDELGLLLPCLSFINTEPETIVASQKIIIEGVEYMFKKDMNQITAGEYISIKTVQHDRPYLDWLPDVLTILIRPCIDGKQEKYDPLKKQERIDLLKRQPVLELLAGVRFFFVGSNPLPISIETSTKEEV